MKAWWSQLSSRDQLVLQIGAGALVVILLIFAVWMPIHQHLEISQAQVATQQSLLAWMQDAAQEAKALQAQGGGPQQPTSGQALFSLVDQSARQVGLANAINKVEPNGDNRVRVRLTAADFDQVMRWLAGLESRYGVTANAFTARRGDAAGVADVQVVLEGHEG